MHEGIGKKSKLTVKEKILKYCGIEIKANEALIVLIEKKDGNLQYIESMTKRIALSDDESRDAVLLFQETIAAFLRSNHVSIVAVKKRSKKGVYAGGALTFKIEALLQVNPICEVHLVPGPTINASNKKNAFLMPNTLHKYQTEAYLTACCYAAMN